jgi:phage terminase large subunit-like protein
VTFPNGAIAITYSSEEPDLLRGPAHDAAWVDELATFYDANKDDAGETGTTWSNLQMGLRLGSRPQQVVTTTPKPLRLLKQILADPGTVTTRGNTYENKANLAEAFYSKIISRYEGTRLGRQELHAEILEDIEGAIFQRDWFDTQRIAAIKPRDLQRIVVAIDPAVTSKDTSDDTGIVVAALGTDGRGYLLDDATCKLSSDGWMRRAIGLFHERKGDRIVAEVNNGGDMIEALLRTIDKDVPYKAVSASRGKITRAEPVAALVEQGKISHVGPFDFLEDELCQYTGKIPGEQSPNRLDAYVWAFTELMLEKQLAPRAFWV